MPIYTRKYSDGFIGIPADWVRGMTQTRSQPPRASDPAMSPHIIIVQKFATGVRHRFVLGGRMEYETVDQLGGACWREIELPSHGARMTAEAVRLFVFDRGRSVLSENDRITITLPDLT